MRKISRVRTLISEENFFLLPPPPPSGKKGDAFRPLFEISFDVSNFGR